MPGVPNTSLAVNDRGVAQVVERPGGWHRFSNLYERSELEATSHSGSLRRESYWAEIRRIWLASRIPCGRVLFTVPLGNVASISLRSPQIQKLGPPRRRLHALGFSVEFARYAVRSVGLGSGLQITKLALGWDGLAGRLTANFEIGTPDPLPGASPFC